MTPQLTQAEENLLYGLERLIIFNKRQGEDINHIMLSRKQLNAFRRLTEKVSGGGYYSRRGKVEIEDDTYRGVKFHVIQPIRRNYRKADICEMFDED